MRLVVSPTPDEQGKFAGLARAFPSIWSGDVLDVGCRTGNLRRVLPDPGARYCGVDLAPPADIVADLGRGLPIADRSFDTVVALDVLEHTNDIHAAFGELCRVARTYVLLALPNAYEGGARLRFLLGRNLNGKYGLTPDPPGDRHRWLFSLDEARRFAHVLSPRFGFAVRAEGCLVGPRRNTGLLPGLVRRFPNLLAPAYVTLLRRDAA